MPLTTPLSPAQQRAQQDVAQAHQFLTQFKQRVDSGVPAIPVRQTPNTPQVAEVPAISGEDYRTALGQDLEILQEIFNLAL